MTLEKGTFPENGNKIRRQLLFEIALMAICGVVVFMVATRYDVLEHILVFSRQHEAWGIDELVTVFLFLVILLIVFSIRHWIEFRQANLALFQRNKALHQALIQIKELKGIIPICSACKKIRDDEGFWHQVESYIESHTHAEFTHGICPECTRMLYPEYIADKEKTNLNDR